MNLTKEQILSMPAGREMDAWVAELIMGYRRAVCGKDIDGNFGGTEYLISPETTEREIEPYLPRRGAVPLYYFCPEYSNDLVCAFEVLNTMVARRKRPKLSRVAENEWLCSMGHLQPEAYAGAVPLAICRAALLSVLEAA